MNEKSSRLVQSCLNFLRKEFYSDKDKMFFQQYDILVSGVTYPAKYLHDRGVCLPEKRVRQILWTVLLDIKEKGHWKKAQFFCRYFLGAVQKHMIQKGESYYDEGKTMRTHVDNVLMGIIEASSTEKIQARKVSKAAEESMRAMTDLHNVLISRTKKRAKKDSAKQTRLKL
jgi:hypothetical protein